MLPSWLKPTPPPSVSSPSTAVLDDGSGRAEQCTDSGVKAIATQLTRHEDTDDAPIDGRTKSAEISLLIPTTAFAIGFVGGLYSASKRAGLVFMAENAHRRPTTVQGWYFYNKTKNYRVILAGLQGGARSGAVMALWAGTYVTLDYVFYKGRQALLGHGTSVDSTVSIFEGRAIDGALAGCGSAVGAMVLYRLPRQASLRAVTLATIAGSIAGASKDLQTLVARAKEQSEAPEPDLGSR